MRRLLLPIGWAGPHFPLNEVGNPVSSIKTRDMPVQISACGLDNDNITQFGHMRRVRDHGKTSPK